MDSLQPPPSTRVPGGVASLVGQVSANNSLADTNILTYSIPAGTLTVGTQYVCEVVGNVDNSATAGTINFWVKIATTKIATLSVATPVSAQTLKIWWARFLFTARTNGSAGTVLASGYGFSESPTAIGYSSFPRADPTTTTTLDTTVAQVLTLGFNWTAAVVGNIARADHASIGLAKL